MNLWRRGLPLTLAVLCGSLALHAQVKINLLTPGAEVASYYAATGWSALHGAKRVTLPLLNVTFVTDSGFLPASRDAVDRELPASIRLAGLQPADFTKIADAVHDALVAELRAQGVEVMSYDPMGVDPGYRELARRAPRAGRERAVPEKFQEIADAAGARQSVTYVAYGFPWIQSFELDNYLPATRLARDLDAVLPIVSVLVDFIGYSTDRSTTFDWGRFAPKSSAGPPPALRAFPQIFVAAGSADFLTADGQTSSLTLKAPVGYGHAFVAHFAPIRGHTKLERLGGSYEVTVDPEAYRRAVLEALAPQMTYIARTLAAGMR